MSEKIPTVKIEFKHLPDFILSEEEYKKSGDWNGFLSEYSINPKDVKEVKHLMMRTKDYPLQAWEG
jgi:hypothetical protein